MRTATASKLNNGKPGIRETIVIINNNNSNNSSHNNEKKKNTLPAKKSVTLLLRRTKENNGIKSSAPRTYLSYDQMSGRQGRGRGRIVSSSGTPTKTDKCKQKKSDNTSTKPHVPPKTQCCTNRRKVVGIAKGADDAADFL